MKGLRLFKKFNMHNMTF